MKPAKQKTERLAVDRALHSELKARAARKGIKLQQMAETVLRAGLKAEGAK